MSWSDCSAATKLDNRLLCNLHFRVYDATSRSRYVYPIGIEAAHPNFQGCSGRTWQRDFQPREGEIGAQAVRHITGRWAGDRGRDTINTGIDIMDLPLGHAEDSPYISTTMSFDWAFYELARRLTRRNVYGHVVDKVSFATINAVDPSDSYKGIRPRRTKHCVAVTLKNNRKGNTLLQESTRYGLAIRFAEASSECLYFGKIFDRDVYNLHHSTRERLFVSQYKPLVKHFFRPKKTNRRGETWIDRLVFDPQSDTFYEAQAKFDNRRRQLEMSGFYDHHD